jgi:hypothetical protein
MAKKRLSRDQKRKAKLAKRAKKGPVTSPLAYEGNKYKTEELEPIFLETETGIYTAYRASGGRVADHHVRSALERMIGLMRGPGLPPYEHACEVSYVPGQEEELVIWGVRHNWHHYFDEFPHPGVENLVGVLRTILGSMDTWSTPGRESRGYLTYLRGSLRQAGVDVDAGPEEDEGEDELYQLGAEYCEEQTPEAREAFLELANELIEEGEGERVADVAQELLDEFGPDAPFRELSALSLRAQHSGPRRPGHDPVH